MHKESFIRSVVAEDIGRGDLFGFFGESKNVEGYILAKSNGVFAGREYVDVFAELYPITIEWLAEDGKEFFVGEKLLFIRGESKTILALERSILNIILHASSIATLTSKYAKALYGTKVKLLDTRKTRPMLRIFEKYAVRCGGGINHRMGLDDALMLKDTHLATIDDLSQYIKEARKHIPFTTAIEIESESVDFAKRAMEVGADIVMCDNMTIDQMKEVVSFRNSKYPHVLLEASGNVTLDTIGDIAKCGVDAISTGSIIHQANWIDLSMKIEA
ncbi:MAG: carboxylating nicotinate-nucleotide diphosphorylase [Sulfurovaceae bacterium]|nr:carboxylating nicotinate-nucleotide diphosphorylase [Sulfurovaceae bacterium]MDD5548670.1 carboxylating nicotinate-nucleotide diphosphorylase [Sulfurovaceae bacterium]